MSEVLHWQAYACAVSAKAKRNLDICRQRGMWGFTRQAAPLAPSVRPGDFLWFYVAKKGFTAVARATSTSEPFSADEQSPWDDGREYVLHLHIEFVADTPTPVPLGEVPHLTSLQLRRGFARLTPPTHTFLAERCGTDLSREGVTSSPPAPHTDSGPVSPGQLSLPQHEQDADHDTDANHADRANVVVLQTDGQEVGSESRHIEAQWRLARIGKALGLDVWIPSGDRHWTFRGERLGDLSTRELPQLGLPAEARRIVENIDVLWLNSRVVVCAFEIEHTTPIYSGILRLSDLVMVQPYSSILLFIVSSSDRREKIVKELQRPTFSSSISMNAKSLAERCRFLSYERLGEHLEFAEKHGQYLRPEWVGTLGEDPHAHR